MNARSILARLRRWLRSREGRLVLVGALGCSTVMVSSVAADRIDEGIRRLAAGVIAGRGRRAAAEGTRPLV